ncbi:MAG: hypothetical protein DHS20C15_07680 [Planctomycetota bacterium]|nr:MAG: hypothetical protein DHS20C15_07680 [Planctomycetota bacterium]
MPKFAMKRLRSLFTLTLCTLLLAACSASTPSHMTRLWPYGRSGDPMLGLAVHDGVLVLARPHFRVDDRFEIQFPVGNSTVTDVGYIARLNNDLAVVRPFTARLAPARLSETLPAAHEQLYLALRDEDDEPLFEEVTPWHDGVHGDWLLLDDYDSAVVARDWAGAGVYVKRNQRWRVVGILAGITAELPQSGELALGYIGLLEIARILPDELSYFDRDERPLRPDIEHGLPLQPGDLNLPPDPNAPAEAPPLAPPPEAEEEEGSESPRR